MSSDFPNRTGLASFRRNVDGNVAIAFGIAVIPLMAVVGAAVDFRMASNIKSGLQSASDSAILAAMSTRNLSDTQRAERAALVFRNNAAATPNAGKASTVIDIAGTKGTITATLDMPTTALKLVGISTLPVQAKSTARTYAKRIEMSLMTDVTGSMDETVNGSSKIDGLKLAARDLLDVVLPDDMPAGSARVALIPFSNYVNAGDYASAVTGLPATRPGSSTDLLIGCVTERTGRSAGTDALPGPSDWIGSKSPGASGGNYSATGDCMRSGSGSSSVLPAVHPLTEDKNALLSVVNNYTASGSTAGHIGTAWAWYAISPKWNSIWGLSTPIASSTDPTVMKVAVLMTDGEYNTQYSSTDSKTQALALCNGMKAAGITVYTVGFGMSNANATDIAAMDTLSRCASSSETFFVAYDGSALRDVFKTIGGKVNNQTATLTD